MHQKSSSGNGLRKRLAAGLFGGALLLPVPVLAVGFTSGWACCPLCGTDAAAVAPADDVVANGLRVEVKKIFEHDLASPQAEISAQELSPQIVVAAAELRASLQNAIRTLCAEIRPGDQLPELASDRPSRSAASDRLRREIWMFQQILRAFLAKAEAAKAAVGSDAHDRWVSTRRIWKRTPRRMARDRRRSSCCRSSAGSS